MWPFSSFKSQNHYSPHKGVTFEGYYNKYRLPSGGSIALIISAVPGAARQVLLHSSSSSNTFDDDDDEQQDEEEEEAKNRKIREKKAFMISFTYVSENSEEYWQKEYFPDHFDIKLNKEGGQEEEGGFKIIWDKGEFEWIPSSSSSSSSKMKQDYMKWELHTDEINFQATTMTMSSENEEEAKGESRIPWNPKDYNSTPAGFMASLPLPIQWHVHSVDSLCQFSLSINPIPNPNPSSFETQLQLQSKPKSKSSENQSKSTFSTSNSSIVHPSDKKGLATVHIEKNWAISFPTSYIWIQARDYHKTNSTGTGTGISIAGGSLLPGIQAYLIGYQGNKIPYLNFVPPTTTSIFGLSLGLDSVVNYKETLVKLDIRGWFTRLKVEATAPDRDVKDTFFSFAAPLSNGHQENYCAQSFGATITSKIYKKKWWAALLPLCHVWPLSTVEAGWEIVEEKRWERGSLEFGGGFYIDHHEN